MTKIAQQKALEAYPIESHEFYDCDYKERNAFKQGYDQAMQDFLEKAEKFFNEELFTRFSGAEHHVSSNKCLNLQQFVEYFKNYMQDESN